MYSSPLPWARGQGWGLQTSGPTTPESFQIFVKAELEKYSKLVKDLNIKAE